MYNLPAQGNRKGVFVCSCGFNKVKGPIRNNGGRYCPVCGSVLTYVESHNGGSDFYQCPSCCETVQDRLTRQPVLAERLERSRGDFSFPFFVVLVVVFLLVSSIGPAVIVKGATEREVEVRLEPDPVFEDVTDPNNIGRDRTTNYTTTLDVWRNDLGSDFQNGTYYGTLFPGSSFEFRFKPYWIPDQDARGGTAGRYSHVLLSSHFNFSSRIIMNGATEYWLKVPVLAQSIEMSHGLYLAIWKDKTDLDQVRFDERTFWSNQVHTRPAYDGKVPDDLVGYYPPDWVDHIGDPLTEGSGDLFVRNDHVYVKVHSVIQPFRDYVVAFYFRLPQDGSLVTLFSTAESPAGNDSRICFADYRIVDNWHDNHTYQHIVTGQEVVDLNLDLDWSWIFTEGMGEGGLFGVQVEITNTTTLATFPFMNTTVDTDPGGTDDRLYPSFMLPWISEDTFNMTFTVANLRPEGVFGGWEFHHWQFTPNGVDPDDATFTWSADVGWNYTDFALFSVNWTLDMTSDFPFEEDDQWNVRVDWNFHDRGNLTLLCYDKDRPEVDWGDVSEFETNSTKWPFCRPYVWDTDTLGISYLEYGIMVSAWASEDTWKIRTQTSSGQDVFTHYFPHRVYLSSLRLEVCDSNNERVEESQPEFLTVWEHAQDLWAEGEYIKSIGTAIRAVALAIWDGSSRIYGWLKDGLSSIWEGMKALGNWIATKLLAFYDWITDFFEDLWDLIVDFWETAKYLVAPILLMAIYGGTIKVSSSWLSRRLEAETKKVKKIKRKLSKEEKQRRFSL